MEGMDASITNGKGRGILQFLEIAGSVVTLSAKHTGLFMLGGNKVYKGCPPNRSGQWGLGYLAPSVTKYSTLNAAKLQTWAPLFIKLCPINVPAEKS